MRLIAFALIVALCAAYIPAGAQSGWLVIVSPGTGEALSGRNAEVSVSYNTGSSDRVTRIELAVDGVNYGVKYLSAPTDRGVASFLVDTSRLGNGGHTVLVKIFSGDRLIGSTSSDCRVGNQPVDVLPPDVKFVGIRNGSVVTGVMNVKLSAADGSGEDPLVSVFVDKSLKMIKNSAPYQYTWNSRDYDDGKHVLTALAYDGAGNKGEAEAVEVVVKNSGREPMPVTPAVEKTPLSSRSASAPVKPSIAAVPQDTIKPVVPVERPVQSSSARAAEPRTTPVGSIGGPVAAVERAGRTASRSIDLQPIIMAQATKPTIPTERAVPSASPQSADRQAAATAPTSASITGSEKPMVVAVLPEMTPSSTFDPEMPQVRAVEAPEVKPVSAPTTTQPQAVAPPVKPDIVAALPEDMSAPAVPEVPSAAAPVATPATQHTRVQEPRMRSEEAYSSLGQKLARPEEPVHQPVRIAMAPRQEPVALPPSLEPRKMTGIVLQTVPYRRTIVTELRHAVGAAGGGITSWDQKTRTVVASFGGKKISLQIDRPIAYIGGKKVMLSQAPRINSSGRTMVDIRLLKAVLGARIELDKSSRQYVLNS